MTTPAQELREAARLMRERAAPLTEGSWESLPWHTEECADNDSGLSCCCIVAQGEIKPFSEAQVPAIQYVADAESPEFAVHIASWHPGVALAVADLLEDAAALFERDVIQETPEGPCCAEPAACSGHGAVLYHQGCDGVVEDGTCQCFAKPLAIARAFLGTKEKTSD